MSPERRRLSPAEFEAARAELEAAGTRTLRVEVELTVEGGADDEAVTDALVDRLTSARDEELPGVVSVDDSAWRRVP